MTNAQIIATMTDIFAHRLVGEPVVEDGRITWRTNKSIQTLGKFVRRADDAGIEGVEVRGYEFVSCDDDNI